MELVFEVRGQMIQQVDVQPVVCGASGTLIARFLMDAEWERAGATAVFCGTDGANYSALLDGDGCCAVPWEAAVKPGVMSVSLFAGSRMTGSCAWVRVLASGYTDQISDSVALLPTAYEQLTSELGALRSLARTKADAVDVGALNGRIDLLVAHAGDESGNSELQDIRVGGNGVTYATAGGAVRAIAMGSGLAEGAVTPDKAAFMEYVSGNVLNPEGTVSGFVAPKTGELTANANYITTAMLPVMGGRYLVSSMNGQLTQMRFVAQYDADGNVLPVTEANNTGDGTAISTNYIRLYDDTRYVRVTNGLYSDIVGRKMQLELADTPACTAYQPYSAPGWKLKGELLGEWTPDQMKQSLSAKALARVSPLYGKKVAWLGTSVTKGYQWCAIVNDAFGFDAVNCGVNGTALCYEDAASMCTQERLRGQCEGGVAIPSDVELIFVEAGVNDWARNRPLGAAQEGVAADGSPAPDDSNFCGAAHRLFRNLAQLYPGAEVIALGDTFGKLPDRSMFSNAYGLLNNQGLISLEYGDALVDVAGRWGHRGWNMGRRMGVNDGNVDQMQPDGLHLTTEEAYNRAARAVIDALLEIRA
ncbi:MAG: SGNH/GDSL hydrolase family protein [Clostridia bacterium]|nr:SGNH/GDSL hydrolase family protein [Clostridia bacterium]